MYFERLEFFSSAFTIIYLVCVLTKSDTDFLNTISYLSQSFLVLEAKQSLDEGSLLFSTFEDPKTRCDRLVDPVFDCCVSLSMSLL